MGLPSCPGHAGHAVAVEGSVRAQVSLDRDADRFAIGGDADATIDRLMRDDGELARGVHLQARIREQAIEFSTPTASFSRRRSARRGKYLSPGLSRPGSR